MINCIKNYLNLYNVYLADAIKFATDICEVGHILLYKYV